MDLSELRSGLDVYKWNDSDSVGFSRLAKDSEVTMNIFRLVGDLSHLAAIIILLLKIWKTRSCAGISGKPFL